MERHFFSGGGTGVVRRDYDTVWEHRPFLAPNFVRFRWVRGFYDPAIRNLPFLKAHRAVAKRRDAYAAITIWAKTLAINSVLVS
jgi:hypothetical protein